MGLATRAVQESRGAGRWARLWAKRTKYLVGAVCIAICIVMLLPLVMSVLASLKTTEEAAAVPPIYAPTTRELRQLPETLGTSEMGFRQYLANSFGTALLTIVLALGVTVPAGYALARFPDPGKRTVVHLSAAGADHPVPGVADSDISDVRKARADQHRDRPRDHPHDDPVAVQPLHHAQQLRGGTSGVGRSSRSRRRQFLAGPYRGSISPPLCPPSSLSRCSRS